jgi:hypothetical protein
VSHNAVFSGWKYHLGDSFCVTEFFIFLSSVPINVHQGGTTTWPIVAMTYIYVRKDITFIEDPASQTLLKAFLQALYTDEYITQCETEFGFVRVAGDLRSKALAAIDSLVTTSGAPEWTFEFETEKRTGQGDYVISVKRESYSEIEQASLVDTVNELSAKVAFLEMENEELHSELDGTAHMHDGDEVIQGSGSSATTPSASGSFSQALNSSQEEQDTKITAALVMSSISFAFWIVAIVGLLARSVTGTHSPNSGMAETAKPQVSSELP